MCSFMLDSNKHAPHTSRGSRIVVFQCDSTFYMVFVVLSSKILKQMPKANSGPSVDSSEIRRSPEAYNTPFNCGRNHLLKYLQYFWDTDWLMVTMRSTPNATQKNTCFSVFFLIPWSAFNDFSKKNNIGRVSRVEPFHTCLNTGVEVYN